MKNISKKFKTVKLRKNERILVSLEKAINSTRMKKTDLKKQGLSSQKDMVSQKTMKRN
jgi:hypothetical protein